MTPTFKFILDERKKKLDGSCPIYLRVTKNRKSSYISTGIRLETKHWNAVSEKVKPSYPNSARLNNHLNNLRLEFEDKLLKEQTENSRESIHAIKDRITGKDSRNFFELADKILDSYYTAGKIGTWAKCTSIINKLRKYWPKEELLLNEITPNFLGTYELYLRRDLANKTNTVHSTVVRYLNSLEKMGLVHNPDHGKYEKVKIE